MEAAHLAAGALALKRQQPCREGNTMSFTLYIIGFVIVIGGLVYGAVMLRVPAHWIAVGAIILVGLAIVAAVTTMREKDRAA